MTPKPPLRLLVEPLPASLATALVETALAEVVEGTEGSARHPVEAQKICV